LSRRTDGTATITPGRHYERPALAQDIGEIGIGKSPELPELFPESVERNESLRFRIRKGLEQNAIHHGEHRAVVLALGGAYTGAMLGRVTARWFRFNR
jgi:hypothetical protein